MIMKLKKFGNLGPHFVIPLNELNKMFEDIS